jgi:putative redox protein
MEHLTIEGARGARLSARVEHPEGTPVAVALFAHCFTCSKDIFAARTIARRLAARGIATVRFDFTGLGSSEGEFASTDFSSNVGDLVKVADTLREGIGAPELLIGHSLGGAAVLVAAPHIPEVKAVATIGAPADAEHVVHNFAAHLDRIEEEGQADVTLAGRTFTIRREFVEDLRAHAVEEAAGRMKSALLVLHSPLDRQVGIDNATRIFVAAKHPKSFISLDNADHLLSDHADARYAADVIAAWAGRFVGEPAPVAPSPEAEAVGTHHEGVVATAAGGRFAIDMVTNGYRLRADEPRSVGGEDSGPTPYDFVSSGLAACTLMTMRMYGERKGWTVDATVEVHHGKVHREHCEDCADAAPGKDGRIDRFERIIRFGPGTARENRERLVEIAGRCPVHRTLERAAAVITRTED